MNTAANQTLAGGQTTAAPAIAPLADPIPYAPRRTLVLRALSGLSGVAMIVTLCMALFYAGTEQTQGNVQRIFYMHVGAFSASAVAFLVTVIGGVGYLITRNARWDKLALSGVQIGLPLTTITLITGAIWARPTWNTWWTRDPRLDSMLVLWVVYAAYLTLRSTIASSERKARFAAVYGILAFASVIYTTIITRERPDTLHPVVILTQVDANNPTSVMSSFKLSSDMVLTLSVASLSWVLLSLTLIWHRVRLENLYERVREIKARVLAQE